MSKRSVRYDLVLYGATGFTGQLAVSYVARQYKDTIKWAVAGRSQGRLEAVAAKEGGGYPDVIVADSTDPASLKAMCRVTKVVATTAGPFVRYGSSVVQACVEEGCDYCDITGETNWVRDMIATHHNSAKESGARIVHFCGHDCVPWDLVTMMLARKIKEKDAHEELVRVDMYDKIKSSPSGGTLETAMGILFGGEGKKQSQAVKALGYDPLLLSREGTGPSPHTTSARNVSTLKMSSKAGEPHRAMFFMAGVNANAVKRSNALLGYGNKVQYCEGLAFPGLCGAVMYLMGLMLFGLSLFIPPVRWLMRKYILPKPGEGPSAEAMEKGFLKVTGVAKGSKGTAAKATITFPVDPGYKDTARMLVESALSLSLDSDKLANPQGGVFTPACCQGTVLLDRLCATGSAFSYHECR